MKDYKVCVVGAGGVGGYLAARLAAVGCEVSVIARGANLQAIQTRGLRVESIAGNVEVEVQAVDSSEAVGGTVDLVIVCTKAWQVADSAPEWRPLLGPETLVLPIQNGVDGPEALACLGPERVLGGSIRIQSLIREPGCICHDGLLLPQVLAGALPGAAPFVPAQIKRMQAAFRGAVGLQLSIVDIRVGMWTKLMAMAAYSGVCSATHSTLGEVVLCNETAALMRAAVDEVRSVALAQLDPIQLTLADANTAYEGLISLGRTQPHSTPSMMRDLAAGKPSELDYQDRRARAQYASALADASLTFSSRTSTSDKGAQQAQAPLDADEGAVRQSSHDSRAPGTFEEQQQQRHRRLDASYRQLSQQEELRRLSQEELRRVSLDENQRRRRSVDKVSDWFQRGHSGGR